MDPHAEKFLSRYAGRSRQNHEYTLNAWGKWLEKKGVPPDRAERHDIEAYLANMKASRAWSPRTVLTTLSHLSNFYRWMYTENIISTDPLLFIQRPRAPHTEREWLGRRDLGVLLQASLEWEGGELAPQVHLWGLCGLRPGEPRGLPVSAFTSHDGTPALVVSASKTPGRERILLPESVGEILSRASCGRKVGPLLLNPRTGRAWTKAAERGRFRRLIDDLGLPHVTPYGLRVSFITLALSAGIPEREVMIGARHSSSSQTARYDRLRIQADYPVGPRLEAWLYSLQPAREAG